MNAVLAQPEQCIETSVPWDDYLRMQGCSITRLKELRRSPLHYQHRLLNPKETAPLSLGRAAHCSVLEPERFDRDHAVWTRRTKSGKLGPRNGKFWEAFKAENAGRTIISEDEHSDVVAIQRAVRGNRDAMRYLEHGDPEVTMQWYVLDHLCKGRADWLTVVDGEPVLVGLKTARDCRLHQFGRQAAQLGYHLQWAFYRDGYATITGRLPKVVEIVVENEAPHAVVVYVIPDEILQRGFDEYMALLEQLDECNRNKSWPGPAIGEQVLSLPPWAFGETMEISYVDE